jgi:RNA-directed DNA polymerase
VNASERPLSTETKLTRINWLSAANPEMKFDCLMHHFNLESLAANFNKLDGRKAVGNDGVSKIEYGTDLSKNLDELLFKMKQMSYRPSPVRQVLIPKEGNPGSYRPLGIGNIEDKIVQGVTKSLLESIYEPLFLDCSYGFRPRRGCHDAIKDLRRHLNDRYVETVIDVDLANFFGTIDHKVLEGFLREKIGDERFIRYITRMFKAGVLVEGDLSVSDEGVPQGSLCSPVLANILAHHVIDKWIDEVVKPHCKGEIALFRYCDDLCICCEFDSDALRVKVALGRRLEKYKLRLNSGKTKLIHFNRAASGRGRKQGSFDFLGFTFYIGHSRKGRPIVKLKTSRKRMNSKLKNVTMWIKTVRNRFRLTQIWKTLRMKLRGHSNYYAVSFNLEQVGTFLHKAIKIVFKWLNRRSQKRSFTWEKFNLYIEANPLPRVRLCVSLY